MFEGPKQVLKQCITFHPPKLIHSRIAVSPFISFGNQNLPNSIVGTHNRYADYFDFNGNPSAEISIEIRKKLNDTLYQNDSQKIKDHKKETDLKIKEIIKEIKSSISAESLKETEGLEAEYLLKQVYLKVGDDANDYLLTIPLPSTAIMDGLRVFIKENRAKQKAKQDFIFIKHIRLTKGGGNGQNVSLLSTNPWPLIYAFPPSWKGTSKISDHSDGVFNHIKYTNFDFWARIQKLTEYLRKVQDRNNFRIRRHIVRSLQKLVDTFLDSVNAIVTDYDPGFTNAYHNIPKIFKFLIDPYNSQNREEFEKYEWVNELALMLTIKITSAVDDEEPPFSDSDRRCLMKYLKRQLHLLY